MAGAFEPAGQPVHVRWLVEVQSTTTRENSSQVAQVRHSVLLAER